MVDRQAGKQGQPKRTLTMPFARKIAGKASRVSQIRITSASNVPLR
jgi:hypothetical protein